MKTIKETGEVTQPDDSSNSKGESEKGREHDVDTPQNKKTQYKQKGNKIYAEQEIAKINYSKNKAPKNKEKSYKCHTTHKNKKPFSCIKEKKIYAKFLNSIYIETTDVVNKTHTHDSNFAPTKNTKHQTDY